MVCDIGGNGDHKAPAVQEGESEELTDFKKQMLALMLALHERVERSEAVQDQQDRALQVRCRPSHQQGALTSTCTHHCCSLTSCKTCQCTVNDQLRACMEYRDRDTCTRSGYSSSLTRGIISTQIQ